MKIWSVLLRPRVSIQVWFSYLTAPFIKALGTNFSREAKEKNSSVVCALRPVSLFTYGMITPVCQCLSILLEGQVTSTHASYSENSFSVQGFKCVRSDLDTPHPTKYRKLSRQGQYVSCKGLAVHQGLPVCPLWPLSPARLGQPCGFTRRSL